MVETVSEPIPFALYGDATTLQPTIRQEANDAHFPVDTVTISVAAQVLHAVQDASTGHNVSDVQSQDPPAETPPAASSSQLGSGQFDSSASSAGLWNAALQIVND
jgi:hypothetical protein